MSEKWIVDIIKRYGNVINRWGNRYLVLADDITSALDAVPPIVAGEKAVSSQYVNFERARISSFVANDTLFENFYLAGTGDIVVTGPALPGITTVNVAFPVSGSGRPSFKYYHGFLTQDQMSTTNPQEWLGSLIPTWESALDTMISDCLTAGVPIVDPQGQLWTNFSHVYPGFGFHQFHKQSPRQPL